MDQEKDKRDQIEKVVLFAINERPMERRKSFMLYTSQYETIKKLSPEQKAELVDAIFAYHNGTEVEVSQLVDIVFTSFREQFKIDDEKYQRIVERNIKNGQKGGRPPEVTETPKPMETPQNTAKKPKRKNNPVGSLGTQGISLEPKKPDDVDDDVEDIKKDITIVISKSAEDFVENSFEQAEFFFDMIKDKIKTKRENPEAKVELDEEVVKFFTYWTAPMKSGKQLWRSEKTFAFKSRLRNWMDKKKTNVPNSFFSNNKPARGTIG